MRTPHTQLLRRRLRHLRISLLMSAGIYLFALRCAIVYRDEYRASRQWSTESNVAQNTGSDERP